MNSVESIFTISYNPIFMSEIVTAFIHGYIEKSGRFPSVLLINLVLPIILYKPSREKLCKANSRSSIRTTFQTNDENFINLGGLQVRYENLKNLSNESLIITINKWGIKIDDDMNLVLDTKSIKEIKKYLNYNNCYLRAAKYLGIIFDGINVRDIYRRLGVYPV